MLSMNVDFQQSMTMEVELDIQCMECSGLLLTIAPSNVRFTIICSQCGLKQRVCAADTLYTSKPIGEHTDPRKMNLDTLKKHVSRVLSDTEAIHKAERAELADLQRLLSRKLEAAKKQEARAAHVSSAAQSARTASAYDTALNVLNLMVQDGECDATEAAIAINMSRSGDYSKLNALTGMRVR